MKENIIEFTQWLLMSYGMFSIVVDLIMYFNR